MTRKFTKNISWCTQGLSPASSCSL